jgi:O-antigen/teichoic acid export membrane protein
LCIAYIFLPSFLLIGLSDFKFLVITQAFMKVLFLVSTIILLQTESDYYIPRLAFNISCLVGAILSLVYIKLKYNIQYKFSNNIRDSITLIVSQTYSFLSQLLTNSNTHIITIFLSITYFDNVLGKFALSIKITMVLYQVVFQPINKSLFPDMALKYSNSNKNEWNKILKTTTIKISIIVLTILIISYIFVQTIPILIDTSKENIELLNILVITNILWLPWCINSYLGFQNYIIQNKQKTIFSILLITSLIVTIVSLINYQAILSPIQFLVLWIVIEICQSCYHIIRLFLKKTYTQLNEI